MKTRLMNLVLPGGAGEGEQQPGGGDGQVGPYQRIHHGPDVRRVSGITDPDHYERNQTFI